MSAASLDKSARQESFTVTGAPSGMSREPTWKHTLHSAGY
jgi:hypothetical protein